MIKNIGKVVGNFRFPESDLEWIEFIIKYLTKFFNDHRRNKSFQTKSENEITNDIYLWLKGKRTFTGVVTVNSQPRTDSTDTVGYYDLKFESAMWNEGQSHFAMENKILTNSNESIKNYTYYPNKSKGKDKGVFDDGGMFRFLSNKYADKQSYGGLIGFIKESETSELQVNLIKKIKELNITLDNGFYGFFTDEVLFEMKVFDFKNSFQSSHIRKDGTNIHLFHLLFKFN